MGDRVSVLKKGVLQQVGTPAELFDHPVNLFVAGFIGSPAMNFAMTKINESNGTLTFDLGDQTLTIGDKLLERRPAVRNYVGKDVIVGIRPQDFEDASLRPDAPESCRVKANLDLVEAIGTETLLHFTMNAPVAVTEEMKELAADVGGEHEQELERRAAEGRNEFVAQVEPKSGLRQGQPAELVIDISQLHFFDPQSAQSSFD